MIKRKRFEADDDDDDRHILKDGERVRVPMFMMDGSPNPALSPLQRAVAEDEAARSFGLNDALAMHKPGFRDSRDTAALDALAAAYRAYDAADAEPWKSGSSHDPSGVFIGEQEGAVRLVCAPDQRRDAQTEARAQAYADYDRQMADAWRNPR